MIDLSDTFIFPNEDYMDFDKDHVVLLARVTNPLGVDEIIGYVTVRNDIVPMHYDLINNSLQLRSVEPSYELQLARQLVAERYGTDESSEELKRLVLDGSDDDSAPVTNVLKAIEAARDIPSFVAYEHEQDVQKRFGLRMDENPNLVVFAGVALGLVRQMRKIGFKNQRINQMLTLAEGYPKV